MFGSFVFLISSSSLLFLLLYHLATQLCSPLKFKPVFVAKMVCSLSPSLFCCRSWQINELNFSLIFSLEMVAPCPGYKLKGGTRSATYNVVLNRYYFPVSGVKSSFMITSVFLFAH